MNREWIKAAVIRAIKTVAQTAVAMIGTATVISSVDWQMVASASVLAGILSLLTSVAGLPEVGAVSELTTDEVEEAEDEAEEPTEEELEEEAK